MGIFTSIGLLFFPIMGVIALIIGIRGIIKYNQFPKVEAEVTGHDKDLGEKRMMYADIYILIHLMDNLLLMLIHTFILVRNQR